MCRRSVAETTIGNYNIRPSLGWTEQALPYLRWYLHLLWPSGHNAGCFRQTIWGKCAKLSCWCDLTSHWKRYHASITFKPWKAHLPTSALVPKFLGSEVFWVLSVLTPSVDYQVPLSESHKCYTSYTKRMYYFQVAEVCGHSVPWRRPHLPWTVCGL